MAERKEEENFELDKSFQELNSDGGLSYAFFSLLKLEFADRPLGNCHFLPPGGWWWKVGDHMKIFPSKGGS